jgi:mono/diheme cytochrome c family protein
MLYGRFKAVAMAFPLLILVLLLSSEVVLAQDFAADRGRRFAEANCAHCHAIGRFGDSILPLAPPFRTLHDKYPVEFLEEAFAEGIVSGHPSMPQFELPPDQIRDLIAYLKSLEQ